MAIKHSKYKNTGILFELCVRQITADLLNNRDSKAVKILKKYFTNTQLGEEYALYSAVSGSPKLSETKSEMMISTIVEQRKKLDKQKLDKLKYNLIKEIKNNYDIDDFFKAKVDNYKTYAAIYTIFESEDDASTKNTSQILKNKVVILEHLTKENIASKEELEDDIVKDLMKEDKEIRLLTYKILVKKFNDKYSNFSEKQKNVLKEYVYNVTDTVKLKKYINEEHTNIKKELNLLQKSTEDKITKIKLKEVCKLIRPIRENETVKDEVITGILQYHQLIEELNQLK